MADRARCGGGAESPEPLPVERILAAAPGKKSLRNREPGQGRRDAAASVYSDPSERQAVRGRRERNLSMDPGGTRPSDCREFREPALIACQGFPRLLNLHDTAGQNIAQDLARSGRPLDFDSIHALRRPQAEVEAEIILRQVAAAAADLIDLRASPSGQFQLRSERTSV